MRVKCRSRFSFCKKDLEKDYGRLLVLVLNRNGTLLVKIVHKEWDNMAERMMLEFAESGHPIFRAISPLSRGVLKKQRPWKTVDTLLCRFGND